MTSDDPVANIRALKDRGILYEVFKFPEGYLDWDLDQKTPYHELTVYEHTLEALKNLTTILSGVKTMAGKEITNDDKLVANLAILFHDLGKLNPKIHGYKIKDGVERRTYYGHEEYSIEAAEYILVHLGFAPREIDRVKRLIDCARRVNPNYTPSNEKCNLSRKALGKFARLAGDDWLLAVLVGLADASGKKKGLLETFDMTYYSDMIEKLKNFGPEARSLKPLLRGDEIVEIIGRSGPIVGEIVQRMIEWQLANPKVSRKDAIGFALSFKDRDEGS